VARRVTRVSRGIRLPVEREPVLPPPSVRDQVVGMPEWLDVDPEMAREPPPGTSTDVLEEAIRPFRRQEIAARRKRRGRRLTDV
jgi:hypothetical protein